MQFFKKKPFAHRVGKPRACPGDKADVYCAALPSADAGGFSAAQQAHDPQLCSQGESFHAVEEQRAVIRQLAFAGPAAFTIESKQFAAHKAARDASAVHSDEGGLPAASRVVDGLSEVVPLRPFLAREQDRSVMPRGAADRFPYLGNGGGSRPEYRQARRPPRPRLCGPRTRTGGAIRAGPTHRSCPY